MADPYLTPEEEEELKKLQGWRQSPSYTPQDNVVPGPSFDRPLVSLTGQVSTDPGVLGGVQGPSDRSWNSVVDPTKQATGQRGYDPRFDDPDYGKEKRDRDEPRQNLNTQGYQPPARDRVTGTPDDRSDPDSWWWGREAQQDNTGRRQARAESGRTENGDGNFITRWWDNNKYLNPANWDEPSEDGSLGRGRYADQGRNDDPRFDLDWSSPSALGQSMRHGIDDVWEENEWQRPSDFQPEGEKPKQPLSYEGLDYYGDWVGNMTGDIGDRHRAVTEGADNKALERAEQRQEQLIDDYTERVETPSAEEATVNEVFERTLSEKGAEGAGDMEAWFAASKAALGEAYAEAKDWTGGTTVGGVAQRAWNVGWGTLINYGLTLPGEALKASHLPGSEFSYGEGWAAVTGAFEGTPDNFLTNVRNNFQEIYERGHGGKDVADMTPEEREAMEWARLNGHAGIESQAAAYDMLSERDEAVQRLVDYSKELYANGNATEAAIVGAQAEEMANMTENEILESTYDFWRAIGPEIILDPLNAVDWFVGAAELGPAVTRARRAYRAAMSGGDELTDLERAAVKFKEALDAGHTAGAGKGTGARRAYRQATGFFQMTPESRSMQDTGTAWASMMRAFGQLDDKSVAQNLLDIMLNNPERLPQAIMDLEQGVVKFTDPKAVDSLMATLPYLKDNLFDPTLIDPATGKVAAQPGKVRFKSLEGTGAFDARQFSGELLTALADAADSYHGVKADAGSALVVSNLLRGIMSEQYLNTSLGHLFRNATSAVGHLTLDGQMTLKPMDDIVADLKGKLGSMGDVRVDEAYGGVADANNAKKVTGQQGAAGMYSGSDRFHRGLRKVPILGPALIDETITPRWAGAATGGEQNFYTRGFYSRFTNSLRDIWSTQEQKFVQTLVAQGVPQQQAQQLASIVVAQGVQGNKQSMVQAVQNFVTGKTNPMSLQALGLQGNEFMSPKTYGAVSNVFDQMSVGALDPNAALKQVNDIFNDERRRVADMMREAGGTDPARHFTPTIDDSRDVAEATTSHRNAAKRAGSDADQAATTDFAKRRTQEVKEVHRGFTEALVNAGDLTPAQTQVFMDAWSDIQSIKDDARVFQNRAHKEAIQSNSSAGWAKYQRDVDAYYTQSFQQQREILNDLPVAMAENRSATRATSARSVEDLMEEASQADLDALEAAMASGDSNKALQAQRQYVDYYNVEMFTTAQRLGATPDMIGALASAEYDRQMAAMQAVSDVNALKWAARKGEITWGDYYRESGEIWEGWAHGTRQRYAAAEQDMYRMANRPAPATPGRPADTPAVPTLNEIRALAADAGFGTFTESTGRYNDNGLLNFAKKHLGGSWKSLDELDPADLAALEGKLEQRARRVKAGVTNMDDYINPVYGDTQPVRVGSEVTVGDRGQVVVSQVLEENGVTSYVGKKPDGTEVTFRPGDIDANMNVPTLVDDNIDEVVKIDGKYYTVDGQGDIVQVYNAATRSRLAMGNSVNPTISDALVWQFQQLTAAQKRTAQAVMAAANNPQNAQMTRQAGQAAMAALGQITGAYDDALYAATRAAKAGADFSMLNYASRRGFDTLLASVVPYHYWFTRSSKTWLERIVAHPGVTSAYYDAEQGVETMNEQDGIPQRYDGQVQVGNTGYFTKNPWRYAFPLFDLYESNGYADPDNAQDAVQRGIQTMNVVGLGTFPLAEAGYHAAQGEWDQIDYRGLTYPLPVVSDAVKAVTGEPLAPWLDDQWGTYRTGRGASNQAAEAGTQEADYLARYAQQMAANVANGEDPMKFIPAHMQAEVEAAYKSAGQEGGFDQVLRSGSRWFGPQVSYLNPAEITANEAKTQYREAGYDPSGNQSGSQAAKENIAEENPFVYSAWAKNDLLPGSIEGANMGQDAQTSQYWDEYLAISEQEMKALTQAVLENPSIGSDELRDMRGPYWEQKEALDAKYPDRNESTDARYKATGTKDRRQSGMNPIEEANQIVMDVLAYKPPKPNDVTDEFGWPPRYPEGLDPDNNPKDKETQRRYYEAKGTYEEDRVTHASRVLEQLAVEQGQGGMMASQMYVEQILLGQYTTELLRGYDSRYESVELMARNEQWDIQGAQKQEDFARWEAEKQARLATVADAMGAEVAQAMDAYGDLPESQKAAYREAHPELYEAWAMAYNPTQYAETKALFGEDIYELARSYTPYGEDKEAWKQWRDSHSEEDYTRLKGYWGYSKEQKELRGEQVDAGDGFTQAPKWTDVAGTQDDPRNKGQQPIGWQYDMTYPGGEPSPASPPPGWQGLDEPGVPDRLMGQGQATQERIMPDGSPADPRVMEREEYLAGPHEFNPYMGFNDYSPPPGTREGPSYTDYDNTSFGPPSFMPGGNAYNPVPGYNALPDITPAERLEAAGGEAALPEGFLEEVQAAAYADALAGGATPEQAAEAAAAAGASYGGGGRGGGRRSAARQLPDLRPYEQRLMAWRMDPWRLYQPNAQGRYGQHLAPEREWRARV